MQQLALTPTAPRSREVIAAAAFWGFTYSLFSYRAQLRFGDEALLIDAQRMLATGIGALLYFAVVRWLISSGEHGLRRPLLILATILPATLIILLARVLFDQVEGAGAEWSDNLRWVTVWSGYFGLWISATLALRLAPLPGFRAHSTSLTTRPLAQTRQRFEPTESIDDWDTVLDWLAIEMADLSPTQRRELAERIVRRAGYEVADPIGAAGNPAVGIAHRLAAAVAPPR